VAGCAKKWRHVISMSDEAKAHIQKEIDLFEEEEEEEKRRSTCGCCDDMI